MSNEHCSSEQIQALVDHRLREPERVVVESHLSVCEACSKVLASSLRLDASLRSLPLEGVGTEFTRRVMLKLQTKPKSPFLFRVLENVAYLFGLSIVLAVMLTVFLWTGVIDSSKVETGENAVAAILSDAGDVVSRGIGYIDSVLHEYLPFVFGKGSVTISMFVAVVVCLLALTDRIVGRWLIHHPR